MASLSSIIKILDLFFIAIHHLNLMFSQFTLHALNCPWSADLRAVESPDVSYLYFMPVFMLCSLEEGTLWTESCPRLRATIATALNLLRVPVLGLLAFCRFSRSSVLRLTPPRWSVHTSDTCILTLGQLSKLQVRLIRTQSKLAEVGSLWFFWDVWHSSLRRQQALCVTRACLCRRNHCSAADLEQR